MGRAGRARRSVRGSRCLTPRVADFVAIFDVDGTLVDSRAMFTSTMAAAFEAEGLPPPDAGAALRLVGISLPQLVAMLLPEARMRRGRRR